MRKRALLFFSDKVEEQKVVTSGGKRGKVQEIDTSIMLYLNMIDSLTEILVQAKPLLKVVYTSRQLTHKTILTYTTPSSEEDITNKQMALLSLEVLCRHFGSAHPASFLHTALDGVIRGVHHSDAAVISSSLL